MYFSVFMDLSQLTYTVYHVKKKRYLRESKRSQFILTHIKSSLKFHFKLMISLLIDLISSEEEVPFSKLIYSK